MTNILRRVGVDVPEPVRRFLEGDLDTWLRVEEYRDAGSLVVKAEVPGIDPDKDVDITLIGNQLQINVRHEERSEHKGKEGYRSEFRYGSFSRTVTLPAPVEQNDVDASYTDGVLEIRVPIPDEATAQSRKIPVSRGMGTTSTSGTTGTMGGPGTTGTMGEPRTTGTMGEPRTTGSMGEPGTMGEPRTTGSMGEEDRYEG
jgi:HSP20 family protein